MNKLKQIKRLDWYITKLTKRNRLYKYIIIILLLIVAFLISSCVTKTHVITEYDGDRKINWYTTEKQK